MLGWVTIAHLLKKQKHQKWHTTLQINVTVATFPEIDSPELSGLHPNADLTFRVKEATSMMNALMETQPKTGGGGGAGGVAALTPEEIVHKRRTKSSNGIYR